MDRRKFLEAAILAMAGGAASAAEPVSPEAKLVTRLPDNNQNEVSVKDGILIFPWNTERILCCEGGLVKYTKRGRPGSIEPYTIRYGDDKVRGIEIAVKPGQKIITVPVYDPQNLRSESPAFKGAIPIFTYKMDRLLTIPHGGVVSLNMNFNADGKPLTKDQMKLDLEFFQTLKLGKTILEIPGDEGRTVKVRKAFLYTEKDDVKIPRAILEGHATIKFGAVIGEVNVQRGIADLEKNDQFDNVQELFDKKKGKAADLINGEIIKTSGLGRPPLGDALAQSESPAAGGGWGEAMQARKEKPGQIEL